jgi:NTE family protein
MTTAVVLSGGGAHGAYEVGALGYTIGTMGKQFDRFYGVSVGALNSAFMGMYPKMQQAAGARELKDFWRPLETPDIYKKCPIPFGDYIAGATRLSVYDSRPLCRLILKTYDHTRSVSSGIYTAVGAVCWDTGEYRVVSSLDDRRFAYWIMASSSYPIFFLPVKIDGKMWTDGGAINVTPIQQAILDGCDEIYVVVCSNVFDFSTWDPKGEKAIPGYLFRLLDVMSREVSKTDLQVCGFHNEVAQLKDQYANVDLKILMPSRPLVGDSLTFSPINTSFNYKRGYEDAKAAHLRGEW